MKYSDIREVMAALTEVPDVELVELLRKYACLENVLMYYLVQAEIVDRFVKSVEV